MVYQSCFGCRDHEKVTHTLGLPIINSSLPKAIFNLAVAAAMTFGGASPLMSEENPPEVTQANALSRAFRRAAGIASPSVVRVIGRARIGNTQPFGVRIFSDQVEREQEQADRQEYEDISIGSGIILTAEGLILTNSHVLDDAEQVIIRLPDRREFEATDIRRDTKSDLAIFRVVNPPGFQPAKLGNSDAVEIGDWVLAIGSPFELDTTVSAGIISGKDRGINQIKRGKLLQTDAAINPGNSGGPLVNLNGEVIGINTAIASSSGGYQGIGFAIPANHAKWVIDELHSHGQVRRAALGVTIADLPPDAARLLELPVNTGVVVRSVVDNSAASLAGLMANDIIIEFAGDKVRDTRDLQSLVERKPAGSEQQILLIREGETIRQAITVGKLDE